MPGLRSLALLAPPRSPRAATAYFRSKRTLRQPCRRPWLVNTRPSCLHVVASNGPLASALR
eukprot:12714890-Prorocentrum_lima.AAC.1